MDSAKIIRYQNNSAGFTEYSINVMYLGQNWLVKKRFSDFTAVDAALKASGVTLDAALPQKGWFSKFDVAFLLNRARALQVYLDKAVQIYPTPSLIKEFLEVDRNMLAADLKKQKSFRDIRKTDKISSIVNKAKSRFVIIDAKERIDVNMRNLFEDKFPSGASRGPIHRKTGTASSFNSDSPRHRAGGSNSFSSPKGSFSAGHGGDEKIPRGSRNGRGHAASIRLAMQTAEYRSFVQKRVTDCFSRRNYLHSQLQFEEFMAMVSTFPENASDTLAILTSPIPGESLLGGHAMDSCAMVVDSCRDDLISSAVGDPSDPLTGTIGLIADRMLFVDPPPSPTKSGCGSLARPSAKSLEASEGVGLLIRRTTQDSGSNRPPGSFRPAPAYEI